MPLLFEIKSDQPTEDLLKDLKELDTSLSDPAAPSLPHMYDHPALCLMQILATFFYQIECLHHSLIAMLFLILKTNFIQNEKIKRFLYLLYFCLLPMCAIILGCTFFSLSLNYSLCIFLRVGTRCWEILKANLSLLSLHPLNLKSSKYVSLFFHLTPSVLPECVAAFYFFELSQSY